MWDVKMDYSMAVMTAFGLAALSVVSLVVEMVDLTVDVLGKKMAER